MNSEQDLLYPAFQKFYSALSSLERFNKEKSFFENISSLDNFFSEFRNVTFVLQKSLAHTDYMYLYEKLRKKYIDPLTWLRDTRNKITKEQPFELVKTIDITAYMPWRSFEISTAHFSVTNDKSLNSIIEESKKFLTQIHPVEVFFSARFSFFEQDSSENIFIKIPHGISAMSTFLDEFYKQLTEKTHLTEEIKNLIDKNSVMRMPQDMLLVNDYVYYPAKDEFENVDRWSLNINFPVGGKTVARTPLGNWLHWHRELGKTDFERFAAEHVLMRTQQDITPAFMLIFQDETFEIDAFNASNKTTLYRKIHETAQQFLDDDIKEVFFEYSLLSIANVTGVLNMTSKDRQRLATEEWLVLLKIDEQLNEEEYRFFVPGLKCPGYIAQQLKAGSDKKLLWGRANMQPITAAFKKKKAIKDNTSEATRI